MPDTLVTKFTSDMHPLFKEYYETLPNDSDVKLWLQWGLIDGGWCEEADFLAIISSRQLKDPMTAQLLRVFRECDAQKIVNDPVPTSTDINELKQIMAEAELTNNCGIVYDWAYRFKVFI